VPAARWTRSTLDRQAVTEVEDRLRSRHAELTDEAHALAGMAAEASADRGAATHHAEIAAIHRERLTRQIADVDAALARLSCGNYGFCETCGRFIGLDRLRELPFTRACQPCRTASQRTITSPSQPAGPRGRTEVRRISSR